MLLLAIQQRDYPDVQGVLFVSTLLVLFIGFAADLLQRLIDPAPPRPDCTRQHDVRWTSPRPRQRLGAACPLAGAR